MMSPIEEGPVYTSHVSSKNWLEVGGGGVSFKNTYTLQNRRYFGEWALNIILGKIIAAIFDFYSSGRLGKERNLY